MTSSVPPLSSSSSLSSSSLSPSWLPEPLSHLLHSNPVFSGGAGLALVGLSATLLREASRSCRRALHKHWTVSLEVPSKDRAYNWTLHYLARHSSFTSPSLSSSSSSSPSSSLSLSHWLQRVLTSVTQQHHLGLETTFTQSNSGVVSTRFDLVPSPGQHVMLYKNTWVHYERVREKSMVDLQTGSPWETLTLSAFGRERTKKVLLNLLNEAKEAALKRTEGKTIIYTSSGVDWRPFGQPRLRRPLHSVILDQGIAERVLNDFTEFLSSQQWYIERGIPYRRGYLLYGEPGCGKSSFIQALAGHLQYNICVLNLNERSLTDDKLSYLMSTLPPRSLLLLEDIDAAFTAEREQRTQSVMLTFSGLLNALDGVASTEERVVFMTTNHRDRLDSALIRPGRCDVQQYIGHASEYQMRAMFKRFYPEASKELEDEFIQHIKSYQITLAELQGFFLMYKNDAVSASLMSANWMQLKQSFASSANKRAQPKDPSRTATISSPSSTVLQFQTPSSPSFIMPAKDSDG